MGIDGQRMICPVCEVENVECFIVGSRNLYCHYCYNLIGILQKYGEWCNRNMKCKYCGKKVFRKIESKEGNETKMRMCSGCGSINMTGWENAESRKVKIVGKKTS